MQTIIPHLWFDKEAKDAAEFYTSIFPNSRITNISTIHDTPSGDCDIVSFDLWGYSFMSISAGPYFTINPSISFMVNFDPIRYKASNGAGPSPKDQAREELDRVWAKLSEGGKALMPLDKYPFSEHYGWIQDKYGVSWQLILTNPEGEERPPIIPSLLFTQQGAGKAEEASNLYMSLFKDSNRGQIMRWPGGMAPEKEGTVMFTDFTLAGQWFAAMDSAQQHEFIFNEGLSLIVNCDTQEEIDHYWNALSAVPEAEQCGWLKDKYGVSWQITPTAMATMMNTGTKEQVDRVTQAFLQMKKFDIATLQKAFDGK